MSREANTQRMTGYSLSAPPQSSIEQSASGTTRLNRNGYVRISQKELAELRSKARAHDAYLAACRTMAGRQAGVMLALDLGLVSESYQQGWMACLKSFSQAVMDADD